MRKKQLRHLLNAPDGGLKQREAADYFAFGPSPWRFNQQELRRFAIADPQRGVDRLLPVAVLKGFPEPWDWRFLTAYRPPARAARERDGEPLL